MAILLPVYVGTAPGPDIKGVLAHILLRGPDGRLHLMQKALANGHVFLLLPAILTVTQTRRKRTGVLAPGKRSTSMPGLPATLNSRPASDLALCPVRWAGHTGPGTSRPT